MTHSPKAPSARPPNPRIATRRGSGCFMSVTAALEHNDAPPIVHEQPSSLRAMPGWLAGFILLLILAGYAWLEFRGFTPAYTEPDPDGYLILAKRMADGKPLGI